MRLASLNLNQLVALDALLRERHVGRAATKMGVTQSAMSHTLRSLRELMGDPLLVRVGNNMVLTPYAEETQGRLRRGLGELEMVVSGRAAFDPSSITDTFTLAAHDGIAAMVAAPLFAELTRRAPHAALRIRTPDHASLAPQLSEGGTDLALVPPVVNLEGLTVEPVPGSTDVSVVCRIDHPVINKKLTLAQYCRVHHAMGTLTGEGPAWVDHLLSQRGKSRQVRVRVPYLLALAEVVSTSDLVTTMPTGVAEFFCAHWPMKMFPFPMPMELQEIVMCWHPRFDADPPHRFFRQVLHEAIACVTERGTPSFEHSQSLRRAKTRRR